MALADEFLDDRHRVHLGDDLHAHVLLVEHPFQVAPDVVPGAGEHERHGFEPLQRDARRRQPREPRRPQHVQLVAQERHALDRAAAGGVDLVLDREVAAAVQDPVVDLLRQRLADDEADLRQLRPEPRQQQRAEDLRHRRQRHHRHLAGRVLLQRADVRADRVELQRDRLRAPDEDGAGLGRRHAAAVAVEQLDAQLVLELRDVMAQRGLRDAQVLRGPHEAAQLDDAGEIAQLSGIHGPSPRWRRPGRV